MEKKYKQKLNDLRNYNCIPLNTFLMSYCGIYNQDLLNGNLSHKILKSLLPRLKRVSYNYVIKNPNEIYTGNIVLVKDSYNNVAPYLNPKIEYTICPLVDGCTDKKEINQENDFFEVAIDAENLNLYQLSLLRKKYKEQNRHNEYRKICRIIKKKKNNGIAEYHKNKLKIKIKGRDENDKY